MRKSNKGLYGIALAIVAGIVLLGYNRFFSSGSRNSNGNTNSGTKVACINPNLPLPAEYHIHPELSIVIDGKKVFVPANIGLTPGCERVLHTHDGTGQIHIEPNFHQEFTLSDFFSVWGKLFDRDHILDKVRDADHEIVMTVDGTRNEEFERLVLRDKQQIVIEYHKKQ